MRLLVLFSELTFGDFMHYVIYIGSYVLGRRLTKPHIIPSISMCTFPISVNASTTIIQKCDCPPSQAIISMENSFI
jgi:hypothetical protein